MDCARGRADFPSEELHLGFEMVHRQCEGSPRQVQLFRIHTGQAEPEMVVYCERIAIANCAAMNPDFQSTRYKSLLGFGGRRKSQSIHWKSRLNLRRVVRSFEPH